MVVAVEPSEAMIAQPPPGAAPVVHVSVPVPADCTDGFMGAFWRRPEAYLDARVRAGISVFAQLDAAQVDACVQALRADLASGAWHERHADLLELDELDLGYRLLVAPRASSAA